MSMNGHKGGLMRSLSGASLVALLALGGMSSAVGCAKVGVLTAQKAYKDANAAYQQQDYKKASDLYEQAVHDNPELSQAYFFLGNSYDNLWKPSKKGEAANDALLEKAVASYETCAAKCSVSNDPVVKNLGPLSLKYLVQAYSVDRLNDPAKAELAVIGMIKLEPADPDNYFALANIYEQAGLYEPAEQVYLRAKDVKPSEPTVYTQLAGFYKRQDQFDKAIQAFEERAQKEPTNSEAFYTIATEYYDHAFRGANVKDADRKVFVEKGLAGAEQALKLKPDYVEALIYKGLLLRLQANGEKDPAKQAALVKQAEVVHDRAEELRKQKVAGVADAKK
jgi:tetratricopeptide (TPR) repeat protein